MRFKTEICMVASLIFLIPVYGIAEASAVSEKIQNEVLRFHIPANSDSEEDQKIKLQIRDRILEVSKNEGWFSDCKNKENAIEETEKHMKEIKEIADSMLDENGFGYDSEVEICDMKFNERTYGEYTFPEGEYTALRITLGEGKGHNWWCVMYPDMCIPYAENSDDIDAENVGDDEKKAEMFFCDDEKEILKNPQKYRFKLKIAEFIKDLIN